MKPVLTGLGRVFINKNSRNCGNFYKYHSTMKVDGLDKSVGDVTSIYAPNPKRYDEFIEIATISGSESRATSTLSGYLDIEKSSALEELYNQKCSFDLQIHYGSCTRPDEFNQFNSVIVFKDVKLTSYGLTTLTALVPDERAVVNETAAISIGDFYRVFQTNEVEQNPFFFVPDSFPIGIVNGGPANCGDDCAGRTDGYSVWIVPFVNDVDVVEFGVTYDNGLNWSSTPSNSGDLHTGPDIACALTVDEGYIYYATSTLLGSRVFRTSIASILDENADTTVVFDGLVTGTASFIHSLSVSDTYIWAAGSYNGVDGVIYAYNKQAQDLETFIQTSGATFYTISAYDDNVVVTAGDLDTVYYSTLYGQFSQVAVAPTSLNFLTDIYIFSPTHWIVASSGGIYCTSNSGDSWTKRITTSDITKMNFYDGILGYAVDSQGTLRTLDSGNTWSRVAVHGNPTNRNIVVCPDNPNIYWVAAGLDTTPGFLLKGFV